MSVKVSIDEDRRKKVIDALAQMRDGLLSEDVILRAVLQTGRDTDRDTMRADLTFLERAGCVLVTKLEIINGEIWRVQLTDDGLRASQGHLLVAGVARRVVR